MQSFFGFKSNLCIVIFFQEPSANLSSLIGKNVAYISLSKACLMVIKCLSLERDFNVLTLVLDDVPLVLCNKVRSILEFQEWSFKLKYSFDNLSKQHLNFSHIFYQNIDIGRIFIKNALQKCSPRHIFSHFQKSSIVF